MVSVSVPTFVPVAKTNIRHFDLEEIFRVISRAVKVVVYIKSPVGAINGDCVSTAGGNNVHHSTKWI